MARQTKAPPELRVAVDTGGTFTDCVWVDAGRARLLKVFSTPADPSQAIVTALKKIAGRGLSPELTQQPDKPVFLRLLLLHGTTVGTNTLLERKGARVAFVTTEGFEDSIEIGRQARSRLYDFFFDRLPPLASAELRFGVSERTDPAGNVVRQPAAAELQALAGKIKGTRPEAVAISLLFSFANPANERAVAEALEQAFAGRGAGPGEPLDSIVVPLSLSHVVLPEFREYERASTLLVNAYLQPVMQKYLRNLAQRVKERLRPTRPEHGGELHRMFVMQSSGGITAVPAAAREPVRTVLSGPAGGVVGASAMGRRSGCARIISFDMGGTSTDVALVDGQARAGSEGEIAGYPVRVPMLDIHTVGAGGGSIARFDAAGALRVGPESAGADPGPICYGRGEEPTVTDANLLLGRLRAEQFLGGEFTLDVERTRRIVADWLRRRASPLSLEQFAAGVVRVVNATMERALRVVSIERGFDPRDFVLVAFGGAGGMHACELASALGMPRVIVPEWPGALSAYGILVSDVVKDYSRTVLLRPGAEGKGLRAEMESEFARMKRAAEQDLRREQWRGRARYERSADIRYRGQGYELNVLYGAPSGNRASADLLREFHEQHRRRYGYSHPQREIEIVTLRLRARIPAPPLQLRAPEHRPSKPGARTTIFFGGKAVPAMIYERDGLRQRRKYSGPAVITEYSATTVIPPRMGFWVDQAGAIVVATK